MCQPVAVVRAQGDTKTVKSRRTLALPKLRRVQWADGISALAKADILGGTAAAVFGLGVDPG